ncbi:MAG: FIG015373: Membrane protein [uncultured Caballeronia sp.]|nr:MAG: FIG015373: Membrane protein [uncultured Caballeronia sp.]
MGTAVNLWPLIGVAVIIVGFILRFNPMLIVAAAIITDLAAHFPVDRILTAIGTGFLKTRNIPLIILLPLAVIGLLERHGLRERAQIWISGIKAATVGRLLIVLLIRELTAAVGLTGLGGHPQMVRPLLALMVEGAAEARFGKLSDETRFKLRAYSAATDNVGLFFGKDIFVTFGAIVLMTTFLKEAGIVVEPLHVAVWGIPTAICAFLIHGFRLWLLDRRLNRELGALTKNVRGETA